MNVLRKYNMTDLDYIATTGVIQFISSGMYLKSGFKKLILPG